MGNPNIWTIMLSRKAGNQREELPSKIRARLDLLQKNMELSGPIQKSWQNFSSLKKTRCIFEDSYHCHVKKGRPTYVACWRILSKKDKLIEVFYVGTHENAPY